MLYPYPGLSAGPIYCRPFGPGHALIQPLDSLSSP